MIKKLLIAISSSVLGLGLTVMPVFAHAMVNPSTAGIGAFVDFTLGVPSEKDSATVSVKLMIPDGINSVSPIVKPGWKVEVVNSTKQGQPDDDGNVNPVPAAIVWTGGQVPAHQKDFFMFSTQVPAKETELDWKVEQTYADGSVVSWSKTAEEQPKDEKGNLDFSKFGPFSKTMVVNDLKNVTAASGDSMGMTKVSNATSKAPIALSILAILISATALGLVMRKS